MPHRRSIEQRNTTPSFYQRYKDDKLVKTAHTESATEFLQTLNDVHPDSSFTMEIENEVDPFPLHTHQKVWKKVND